MLKSISIVARALLLLVVANLAAPAFGDIAFFTDRLGYTGTVSVYDSLADAQNQVNARSGPHAALQRDLATLFQQQHSFFRPGLFNLPDSMVLHHRHGGPCANTAVGVTRATPMKALFKCMTLVP